jgi:hypothetical protein
MLVEYELGNTEGFCMKSLVDTHIGCRIPSHYLQYLPQPFLCLPCYLVPQFLKRLLSGLVQWSIQLALALLREETTGRSTTVLIRKTSVYAYVYKA